MAKVDSKPPRSSGAGRKNHGKVKLTKAMLMPNALAKLVEAMEYGEIKYTSAYKKGWMSYEDIEALDSMLRHTLAIINGKWIDEESGLPHSSCVLFNAAIFAEKTHDMSGEEFYDKLLADKGPQP